MSARPQRHCGWEGSAFKASELAPRTPLGQARAASRLGEHLEGERDALPAADAQRDDAALEAVAAHRVDQAGRQHRARRSNRMAMRDRTTLDIDDVLGQTELARHDDRDLRKGLVYL